MLLLNFFPPPKKGLAQKNICNFVAYPVNLFYNYPTIKMGRMIDEYMLTNVLIDWHHADHEYVLIKRRSSQVFNNLNWPTLEDRRMKQKSCLMFKVFHRLGPSYLSLLRSPTPYNGRSIM